MKAWWISHRLEIWYAIVRLLRVVAIIIVTIGNLMILFVWYFLRGLFKHHPQKR